MTTAPAEPQKRKFTVEDYHRMADEGIISPDERTELLDGEIYYMTPIGSQHAAHVAHLAKLMERRAGDRSLVWTQNPVRLGEHSEPEPDVALVEDREDRYASGPPEPEDIFSMIEVADSSVAFDRSTKIPLYARHGIAEVWLLNLQKETIEVYREPAEDGYQSTDRCGTSDSIVAPEVEAEFAVGELFVG